MNTRFCGITHYVKQSEKAVEHPLKRYRSTQDNAVTDNV